MWPVQASGGHANCITEIPVFVDPNCFVIKVAAGPVRCNDIASPKSRLCFSAYLGLQRTGTDPFEAHHRQHTRHKSLPWQKHLQPRAAGGPHFYESQGTCAFLAKSAEWAYNGRVAGEWGSGFMDLAMDSIMDAVGYHLVPVPLTSACSTCQREKV
jgi:hypothetical protein